MFSFLLVQYLLLLSSTAQSSTVVLQSTTVREDVVDDFCPPEADVGRPSIRIDKATPLHEYAAGACPIHHVELTEHIVPVSYAITMYSDITSPPFAFKPRPPAHVRRAYFPFAPRPTNQGCMPSDFTHAIQCVCTECLAVELMWSHLATP